MAGAQRLNLASRQRWLVANSMAKKVTAHFRGKSRVRLGSNAAAHLRNVQAPETTPKISVVAPLLPPLHQAVPRPRVSATLYKGCRPWRINFAEAARPHAIR